MSAKLIFEDSSFESIKSEDQFDTFKKDLASGLHCSINNVNQFVDDAFNYKYYNGKAKDTNELFTNNDNSKDVFEFTFALKEVVVDWIEQQSGMFSVYNSAGDGYKYILNNKNEIVFYEVKDTFTVWDLRDGEDFEECGLNKDVILGWKKEAGSNKSINVDSWDDQQ